jgi:hypothetical protein
MTRTVALKLGAFAVVLGLAFTGAYALGSTVGPQAAAGPAPRADEPAGGHGDMASPAPSEQGGHDSGHDSGQTGPATLPGTCRLRGRLHPRAGEDHLQRRQAGAAPVQHPGPGRAAGHGVPGDPREGPAPDRRPARPVRGSGTCIRSGGADGTWTIPFEFGTAGSWRLFADFAPAGLGRTLTLGSDVSVAGPYTPVPLPPASNAVTTEGSTGGTTGEYDVTLAGRAVAGAGIGAGVHRQPRGPAGDRPAALPRRVRPSGLAAERGSGVSAQPSGAGGPGR